MPTYYRGPSAHVTHEVFLVRDPGAAFAISELRDVHVEVYRSRRRVYELRAVYHGRSACLFRTTNERLFGQVKRALVRALEHRDTV
ncbi:MAG: hypothetical protein HOU81_21285 [Hamadaea sp.]|uniref:DUF6232 family protein n=1 Tax=Hamadaea sp. TaxID=2024425 RepID=UPI00182493AA|nr:DUF6232 family protein [Hamadaea sp.]NUR73360.1 hypothetical protein [Hamadaea sp.]NUT21272.1 hypothetical protein [Hamadaea sp.]